MKSYMRRCKERAWAVSTRGLFWRRSFRRVALRTLFSRHLSPTAIGFVDYGDHGFFVDPRDHMIGYSLLAGVGWQRSTFDRALHVAGEAGAIRPGRWFIDVGANIGTHTVYAMRSGHFAGCIAIEPDPRNFALLQRNIAHNGLTGQVRAFQMAASSGDGTTLLVCDEENHGAHHIASGSECRPGRTEKVATGTLDEIVRRVGIEPGDVGFVWIDVEGHEIEVLKGMAAIRSHGVPMVAEVNTNDVVQDRALRALLAGDYAHSLALDAQSAGSAGRLAAWWSGQAHRRSDVMYYNRVAAPVPRLADTIGP